MTAVPRTGLLICALGLALQAAAQTGVAESPFLPVATDAVSLARDLATGDLTATMLTAAVLERIARMDRSGPVLGSVLELNPDAPAIAAALDQQFAQSGPVGPLHGLPVLLKANIDTGDRMATSAGSVALEAHRAQQDAPVAALLRRAGAVLVGKANLSEWANFRSLRSTSGWSSLGGQTRNPWVLDRNPCGSSSGSAVAVAAGLVPLAVGTETDGSIVCPAGTTGIVGIKPTVGLLSQAGIIPIAASQDTAGPMARTVHDAALLLGAMQPDRALAETWLIAADREDLDGLRIGVIRDYAGAGSAADAAQALDDAIAMLRARGAAIHDPIHLALPVGVAEAEFELLLHEFSDGLNAYLAGISEGPQSLTELIAFNQADEPRLMPFFGQEILVLAATGHGTQMPAYREALRASKEAATRRLLDVFAEAQVDALIAPTNSRAWETDYAAGDSVHVSSSRPAAVAGFPAITVPITVVRELPIGVSLIGKPYREDLLIGIAAVIERVRGAFPAPRYLAHVDD